MTPRSARGLQTPGSVDQPFEFLSMTESCGHLPSCRCLSLSPLGPGCLPSFAPASALEKLSSEPRAKYRADRLCRCSDSATFAARCSIQMLHNGGPRLHLLVPKDGTCTCSFQTCRQTLGVGARLPARATPARSPAF